MMKFVSIIVAAAVVFSLVGGLPAAMPTNMNVLVPKVHTQTPGGTESALGGFGYDWVRKVYYTATFGAYVNIRYFDPALKNVNPGDYPDRYNVVTNNDGTSWGLATQSDMIRIFNATDLATGYTADYGGRFNNSCITLNPSTVAYNGQSYGPAEICLMSSTDQTGPPEYQYRRRMLTYDLRQIGHATNKQPDYNTAHDWDGQNPGELPHFSVPAGVRGFSTLTLLS